MTFRKKDFLLELDTGEKEHIRIEQVIIAYKQSFTSVFPLFIAALVVLHMYYQTPVFFITALWFTAVILTLAGRLWLLRSFHIYLKNHDTKRWEKYFAYVMLSSAVVWGSIAFLIFKSPNVLNQFFLIFLIAGIASIASGTLASLFGLAVLFLLFLLVPLFVVMFFNGGMEYHMMGILVIIFFALLASAARRIHQNIMSALVSKILHEKAAQALELSEEHFQTVFKEAPAGIFYYNSDLIIIDSNIEMMQILQIDRDHMIGLDLKKLTDNCLFEALSAPFGEHKGYYEGPYKTMIKKLNLWITLRTSPMYDAKRNIIGGVAIVTDITDRINAEEKIKHQAYFDALTDIPNRVLLKDRIEQALAHYRRHHSLIAIMFLDLDHFKSVNDSLGHHIGDLLLIETASRLTSICRDGDTVSRIGGDEFVILLNELGNDSHIAAKNAEKVAEKIHEALSYPFNVGQIEPIMTSSSIGIALVGSESQTADDLLKFADTAMYQAKKEGRNTTRFYQTQMDEWIKKRLFLENGLRHATKNGELELYYQPVIEIKTKKIIGAEALLRWNHPEMGLIMPDEMISIAEESGLIVPIGDWVMKEACAQFIEWKTHHPKGGEIERIAINVSAIQFRQNDFVDKVIGIVTETGILPSMVEIELTESMIIDKIDTVIEKMKRLRAFGINLSMDDFGTGYSSLAYLKRLPFTTLKIDRSFVRDIMSDNDDAVLVETILSMAMIFNLDVIAEGVETIEQFAFLERHNCRYFQGYLCSKPVQVKTFEELLNHDVQSCQSGH